MSKDIKAFLKTKRKNSKYRPVEERLKDYKEVNVKKNDEVNMAQASRCMDCGTPFCHWACPIGNYIPEWNEQVCLGNWDAAYELLSQSSSFPEITGRICPGLCEASCVLNINDEAITVRENELAIIEKAFANGIAKPNPPKKRTGKKIAVIGSGPAGIGAADMLNKQGHTVVVYEKDKYAGGLLRYGIPDFKLEKWVVERRIKFLEDEGIEFKTNVNVGVDINIDDLQKQYDAICLCGGAQKSRDLNIKGRELKGIHFSMDFLSQSNKKVANEDFKEEYITAKGKKVVVIGGGDTGSDCIGTSNRQGAESVVQLEVLPKPPKERDDAEPWPMFPKLLKFTSSHEEGCESHWSVLTKEFIGNDKGELEKLKCIKAVFVHNSETGRMDMKEVEGSEFEIEADFVLLAIGFVSPIQEGMLNDLGVEYDNRGNVKTDNNYMTNIEGVFSAGDMHSGQSLVVHAMNEGRLAAKAVGKWFVIGE